MEASGSARILTPSPDLLPPTLLILLSVYVLVSSYVLYKLVGRVVGDRLI
jgi:hypothetical protein